jgi:gamma-glutamyl-gamma-aminobutyrate hydrolase PuuD
VSNKNSLTSYFDKDIDNIREAGGITQFVSTDVNSYYQNINGIIIQGGLRVGGAGPVIYQASFPKQVLGVFMNGATASAITLDGFTASGNGFWFAIGV